MTGNEPSSSSAFDYKLEMYVPKAERQFGHFVLPVVHGDELVGRLDSERDRKTNELIVKQAALGGRAARRTGAPGRRWRDRGSRRVRQVGLGQAASATHLRGSPAPRSLMPADSRAPSTITRR